MPNVLLRIAIVISATTRRFTDALTVRYRTLTAQPTAGSSEIPWTAIIMVGSAVIAVAVLAFVGPWVTAQLAKLPQ